MQHWQNEVVKVRRDPSVNGGKSNSATVVTTGQNTYLIVGELLWYHQWSSAVSLK